MLGVARGCLPRRPASVACACTCCLQADLNGHWYNYGARTGLSHIIDFSKILEVGYGYVVESRKEVELPEVMSCCCRIVKFDLAQAVPFPPKA